MKQKTIQKLPSYQLALLLYCVFSCVVLSANNKHTVAADVHQNTVQLTRNGNTMALHAPEGIQLIASLDHFDTQKLAQDIEHHIAHLTRQDKEKLLDILREAMQAAREHQKAAAIENISILIQNIGHHLHQEHMQSHQHTVQI